MNKHALVEAIADKAGITLIAADAAWEAAVDTIADTLADGGTVTVPGFGTFEVRARAARTGRNPQTGEPIAIAAATVPAFKPAAALKKSVNGRS